MNKILFVSHGFACYMSDILFHGFKKLGCDIYEYPQGTHYYGGKGWDNMGRDNFLNFCYFDFKKHELSDDEILEQNYDFVVITSWRPEQPWILENIYKRFKGKIPIIWVDGEDDLFIRQEEFFSNLYFKRELKLSNYEEMERKGIKPITFGIIDDRKSDLIFPIQKKYLLSFIASGHNLQGMRCQMFRKLRDFNDNENIFYLDVERSKEGYLSYKTYNEILFDSQIGISIAGEGYDTYRYWEIPYFGAMLMADTPTIKINDNFTDMDNAVFFKNLNEFEEKFNYLKDNPAVVREISRRGYEHLMKFHTSVNRAEYIINEVDKI
jgi:hypothetical protein